MRDYTELERRMRSLVARLKGVFSDSEANEILHFIDVGEYGVALETMKFIFIEEKKEADALILEEANEIAKMMGMDLKF